MPEIRGAKSLFEALALNYESSLDLNSSLDKILSKIYLNILFLWQETTQPRWFSSQNKMNNISPLSLVLAFL